MRPPNPRVVALGGGHGLSASLSALRRVTRELTAVVTVADDGGSSGRLRREFGVLPPGDLRMALAALCGDDAWGTTWSRVVQHRFTGDGELHGHAVGNLLIVALWELLGDPFRALDWVGRLLGAHGRVLPDVVGPAGPGRRGRRARIPPARASSHRAGPGHLASTTGRVRSVHCPGRPARLPGGGGRRPRRRLGGARARLVVHQRAAAPAGARAGRRADHDPGAPPVRAEPGAAAGRDRGFLSAAPPGGFAPTTPLSSPSTSCSPTEVAVGADRQQHTSETAAGLLGGQAGCWPDLADAGRLAAPRSASCWPPRIARILRGVGGSAAWR